MGPVFTATRGAEANDAPLFCNRACFLLLCREMRSRTTKRRPAAPVRRRSPLRLSRAWARTFGCGAFTAMLCGCEGPQSALDPHGPAAEAIARTWWVMFAGGTAILAIVMALVLFTFYSRPERRPVFDPHYFLVIGGLVLPTVVLTALLIYGVDVGRRAIGSEVGQRLEGLNPQVLVIEITGRQWQWEVRYPAAGDWPAVETADELYLPLDVPVELRIGSADVIHSFWVPGLAGKLDAIPGRVQVLRLMASRPGRLRAQCAEFCGAEHAHMHMPVVLTDAAEFGRWRRAAGAAP